MSLRSSNNTVNRYVHLHPAQIRRICLPVSLHVILPTLPFPRFYENTITKEESVHHFTRQESHTWRREVLHRQPTAMPTCTLRSTSLSRFQIPTPRTISLTFVRLSFPPVLRHCCIHQAPNALRRCTFGSTTPRLLSVLILSPSTFLSFVFHFLPSVDMYGSQSQVWCTCPVRFVNFGPVWLCLWFHITLSSVYFVPVSEHLFIFCDSFFSVR